MKPGRDYDETKTYFTEIKWNSIILLLSLVCIMGCSTTNIDYVLAFNQEPVEHDINLRIPKGLVPLIDN